MKKSGMWLASIGLGFAFYKLYQSIGTIKYFETSDFVELFTKTSGKGETCIYVHGGPGAWSKSFEKLGGNRLESFMKMIYLDQRGCGRSEKAWNKDYSLERMIADLDELIDSTGAGKVFLLAHSFGGVIATNYALKHPDKVKGLILTTATLNAFDSIRAQLKYINTVINSDYSADEDNNIKQVFQEAFRTFHRQGLRYKLLTEDKSTFDKLSKVDGSAKTVHDFAVRVWNYPEYSNDLTEETRNLKVPVLVINGTCDTSIGENPGEMFNFPNSENYDIEGGHLLYYEQNREFVRLVREFVEKVK